MTKCRRCGNDFEQKLIGRPAAFCSTLCRTMWWQAQNPERYRALKRITAQRRRLAKEQAQ